VNRVRAPAQAAPAAAARRPGRLSARRQVRELKTWALTRAAPAAGFGRAAEALAVFEEARSATPDKPGFASAEAVALAALGRSDEAAEQHRQAKELMEIAAGLQRLDRWTLGTVLVESGAAVEAASTRGFPVVAPGADGDRAPETSPTA
jgi:hypothetical protein